MKITSIGLLLFLGLGQYTINAQIKPSEIPFNGTDKSPKEQLTLDFETLTLEQALTFALQHAPAIAEAQITVALAELDLKRTRFWRRLVPSLNINHGYNPAVRDSRIGVGLSLDLNRIWEEGNNAKATKLRWFNTEIYQNTVRSQVIIAVTRSYYDFVAAKKQVELLEDQLSTQLKLSALQKIRFEAGTAQLNPLLSMIQSVANTRLALLKAQADVKIQELRLKGEIGYNHRLSIIGD